MYTAHKVNRMQLPLFVCLNLLFVCASSLELLSKTSSADKLLPEHGSREPELKGGLDGRYEALEVIDKSPMELLALRGFKSEVYLAPTSDGYYVHLVRVINPLVERRNLKRPVIFNHGLLESSTIWLINARNVRPMDLSGECHQKLPDDPMAYNGTLYLNGPMMLANYGYDVWMMSMRGTDWAQKHETLSPLDDEFWDYCLDDFGLKDVPGAVDFVLKQTGAKKVGYVGHSQATFSVFALLSTRPRYSALIEPVVAVAPVAFFDHITSVGRVVFLGALKSTARDLHGPFPANARRLRRAITEICASRLPDLACAYMEMLVSGKGEKWLKGHYSHMPFYTSLKVLRHFGWLIQSKRFSRYDYGDPEENLKRYGQREAPSYKIQNINSTSLVLISTKSDTLSTPPDVNNFKAQLRVPLFRDIYIDKDFDHIDLITDKHARRFVFRPMLGIFEHFERENGVCSEVKNSRELLNDDNGKEPIISNDLLLRDEIRDLER